MRLPSMWVTVPSAPTERCVGLELVQDGVGGGFQRGTAGVYVLADAVFGQDAVVAGVFELGLALDVMNFTEQHAFGEVLGAGLELAAHGRSEERRVGKEC